jgi:hypothetical protein
MRRSLLREGLPDPATTPIFLLALTTVSGRAYRLSDDIGNGRSTCGRATMEQGGSVHAPVIGA